MRFFKGLVALAIVDESHNARGKDTDIAASIHELQHASQSYVFASGTHYGGSITDFFAYWFRFDPSFWPKLGLGWNDVEKAVDLYGVVQEVTKEHESDARKGSGRADTTTTTVAAPGISARLLPHLLAKMVFIGVLDVGAFMPPREEIPEVIDMADPELELRCEAARAAHQAVQETLVSAEQDERDMCDDPTASTAEIRAAAEAVREAREGVTAAEAALKAAQVYKAERDLKGVYAGIEGSLERMAQKRISAAMLAKGTLPRLWAVQPFGPEISVTSTKRSDWGDVIGVSTLFTTPRLSPDHLYPMERRLREIVGAEREEGRTVMCYFFQNDERPMAPRLAHILSDFNPWTLPNSVDPEDREDAIKAAVASGRSVILVPYTRVVEGLNLQVIDTIIWWEMAMNLFHLDQASRRAWRLGKREKVRLYYLVYRHTVAHKKLHKLGSQSGAASLFAGDTPDGALAKSTGADKTTLAQLSSGLEETEEDLKAAFDRRGKELAEALKKGREWIGVIDTLPERLRAYHLARVARAAAAPVTDSPAEAVTSAAVPA
ncbi:MAG TPA: hypothetical protein VNN10_11250, partial [Dehalococcoidia bacterium]|nr:hypothetical protein [Dehalococcoidia bacterium]